MRLPQTFHSYFPSASSSALFRSALATSALILCSLFSLPVICRWTLWTVLAAQRTSSLRRAYRIWETSTTSVRAREGCQSTSVPFVGTAPQVMLVCKDGGEGWASIFTLPLTTTTPPAQMRTDSRQRRTCLKSFVKYFVRICTVYFCKYILSVCCYE